ncbi:putative alcohol dehydrogenase [Aspergillus costaricaensis CBS 115574]|uniref:Alcohol dehydrogenase n=1 Tax=Aspergillus costaricaensis CBS 115574 TaxID=1448317 RepID=A0ACD1I1K1_9EURO|nr:putative alcohol dehydrogenase [Aspergillus costaricaensis CBS 115574]RAK84160.1 putative alcohol dehydrogenase [Aspergillus costaricaensis CBS 115574]
MTLPQTFKQAAFKSAGAPLVIEEVPMFQPGPAELLVKVEACGVCYSDTFAQNNIMGGGFPLVPGHEIIGRIAALGDNVSNWAIGQRVGGAWHGGHDGTCHACRKGWYQMCDNAIVNGETKNGGYAEYCLLNAEAAVRIPPHLPASKYAPILCAGVAVFNSIRHQNISPGETVAVHGLGGLGHLAIQYAARMGYRVIAISRDRQKEKFVRELGAHEYIDASKVDPGAALKKLGGASLIVSTVPSAEVMPPLLKGLGILGKLVMLSVPGPVSVDSGVMLKYGISVQVWPCGHATDTEDAIAFAELQGINCMVEEFPLERANEALESMKKGTVRFRAVLTM